ncbi:hypothetical protein [Acidovorax sp. CCYZU-2555]|uniref:hypothetical protein n=1 Tax=Acidovorax sp. CCYZU-2555 TaxID=2835042 RepID=UPI001BCC1B3C|nr:hypothetical protein [Acidovorax sp. CCYZU-2555]MBS7780127.1 hypothetical protein [Acidovorax sp. CCYZU-2555]
MENVQTMHGRKRHARSLPESGLCLSTKGGEIWHSGLRHFGANSQDFVAKIVGLFPLLNEFSVLTGEFCQ